VYGARTRVNESRSLSRVSTLSLGLTDSFRFQIILQRQDFLEINLLALTYADRGILKL
jgi:hypothetical protein